MFPIVLIIGVGSIGLGAFGPLPLAIRIPQLVVGELLCVLAGVLITRAGLKGGWEAPDGSGPVR